MPAPNRDDATETPETPRTRAEFEAELADLVRVAYSNGVGIEFGVDLRYDDDVPDWEVQITPLRKPSDR